MFVMTESGKMINLARHRIITIRESSQGIFRIVAYIDTVLGMQQDGGDLDIIASFDNKDEAERALVLLSNQINALLTFAPNTSDE